MSYIDKGIREDELNLIFKQTLDALQTNVSQNLGKIEEGII